MVIRRLLILIASLFLLFFLICILYSRSNRAKYYASTQLLEKRRIGLTYNLVFKHYFDLFDQFPINIAELDPITENNRLFLSHLEKLTDPYSITKDTLKYVPLYNDKTGIRSGYLLYSSGVDGRFNNFNSINDTFRARDVIEDFNFYNEIEPSCMKIFSDTANSYSFFNQLFGNKDYLITYMICD